jgi:hypothetical protein
MDARIWLTGSEGEPRSVPIDLDGTVTRIEP